MNARFKQINAGLFKINAKFKQKNAGLNKHLYFWNKYLHGLTFKQVKQVEKDTIFDGQTFVFNYK